MKFMSKLGPLLISVTMLVLAFYFADLKQLWSALLELDPFLIALVLLVLSLNLVVISYRLLRIMRHFGSAAPFPLIFKASISGLVASLLMINLVGSVVGRQLVLRKAGTSASAIALVAGYERLLLALVSGGLAAAGVVYLFGRNFIFQFFQGLPIVFLLIAVAAAVLWLLGSARSGIERETVRKLRNPKRVLEVAEIVFIALISQFLNLCSYLLIIRFSGYDVPLTHLLAATALVSFAASLPISVNGWGVREISSVFAFGALGIPAADATAISVAVGLLNTVVVFVFSPVALLRWKRNLPGKTGLAVSTEYAQGDILAFDSMRLFALVSGSFVAILLFFQFPINVYAIESASGYITLNLGDPLALLVLGLIAAQLLFTRRLPFLLSRESFIWLGMVSLALTISLVVGYYRLGPLPWAIGNRALGWFVILGYFSTGAVFSGMFGLHGVRRLSQILMIAGCSVIAIHLLQQGLFRAGLTDLVPPLNFEGFSANRNAFAFQLLTVLSLGVSFLLPVRDESWRVFGALAAFVITGILLTGSITAVVTLLGVALLLLPANMSLRLRSLIVLVSGVVIFFVLQELSLLLPKYMQTVESLSSQPGVRLLEGPFGSSMAFSQDSASEHWDSLKGAFHMWLDHPILGGGLGAFVTSVFTANGVPLVIHSTYMWVLAEAGLLGVFLVAAIPLSRMRHFWSAFQGRSLSRLGGLSSRQTGIVFLLAVFGIFSLNHDIAYQRIFWLALGALLGAVRHDGAAVNVSQSGKA